MRILKDAFEVLQDQLCYLFNMSLKSCKFPTAWKLANVVLIHKGQDKCNVNNYRPISLLPLPGKLLESLVHKHLIDYLENYSILTKNQWGFRPKRSTADAGAGLLEFALSSLNEKKHAGVIYIYI